ncbi:MAG: ParB/RepB/Spo0J family partition protein [Nitrospiraceae bacterium]
MEKKALGRGLDALLPSASPAKVQAPPVERGPEVLTLELDHIVPNRFQPRREFSESALQALADSITTNGLLQPIVVRRKGDGLYELIAGERRWRASQRAGLGTISAYVRNCTDDEAMVFALVENIQRNDLNPIETALAYQRMLGEFGMTQDVIAQRVGRERSSVANQLRLLNLPDDVQSLVASGSVSLGHAKVLLGLAEPDQQRRLAREVATRQWSVRELEKQVQARPVQRRTKRARQAVKVFRDVEERLQRRLGTKVTIEPKGEGGQIVLHYYSEPEQARLLELLLN